MAEYPAQMQLPPDIDLEIAIPSWHVNGHGSKCRNNLSLNYVPGVGRTCGEDVEISWSQTNALAPSTREMGPGARKETLNDQWNGWNLRKIIGFRAYLCFCIDRANKVISGSLFLKRFKDASVMRQKHREAFDTFSNTFSPRTILQWTKMVEAWLGDRTKPNPYEEPSNSESQMFACCFSLLNFGSLATTLQDVRLELAKEDADAMVAGATQPHSTSPTAFLMKGLELEESQCVDLNTPSNRN